LLFKVLEQSPTDSLVLLGISIGSSESLYGRVVPGIHDISEINMIPDVLEQ